ncbi:Hypothetical protein AA314_02966 [Archangium gephyra]|uniref:Uncharacterized protein n=1 Tax=Archangium gephyra TaxID=48 RepID=A0AAC8Q5C7_9BACT|nr:Hypothetical protein AA314_02966 [Archangium gephyra]
MLGCGHGAVLPDGVPILPKRQAPDGILVNCPPLHARNIQEQRLDGGVTNRPYMNCSNGGI